MLYQVVARELRTFLARDRPPPPTAVPVTLHLIACAPRRGCASPLPLPGRPGAEGFEACLLGTVRAVAFLLASRYRLTSEEQNRETANRAPRSFYWILALLGGLPLLAVSIFAFWKLSGDAGRLPGRVDLSNLSEAGREEIYARLAADVGGIWDATPEPRVGRLLQRGIDKPFKSVPVVSNNAGLRAGRDYVHKPEGTFRIALVGDSYVMGSAGLEEDRMGDQMESILRALPEGRHIEVYSIGLGGWSTLSEATYLTSRLSAYEPDVIVVVMIGNDITSDTGVTGVGASTNTFSPAYRALGSATLHHMVRVGFGVNTKNLLHTGIGPASEGMWLEAMQALGRLETLQHQRGGEMLVSFLQWSERRELSSVFQENVLFYADEIGMKSPFLLASHFPNEDTRVPGDGHPNRKGHQILAVHYLHALAARGWIPVARTALPPLHRHLTTKAVDVDVERLERLRREAVADLSPQIDFNNIRTEDLPGFLGGILSARRGHSKKALTVAPYGSLRTVFLLSNSHDPSTALVTIEVPPKPELFPFEVSLTLHGTTVDTLALESSHQAGTYTLSGSIPARARASPALEVRLDANRYWSEISRLDEGMRSYRLLRAEAR